MVGAVRTDEPGVFPMAKHSPFCETHCELSLVMMRKLYTALQECRARIDHEPDEWERMMLEVRLAIAQVGEHAKSV